MITNIIHKTMKVMEEPNQIKNGCESERMSAELNKNDTMRSEPVTSNDALQEQSLNLLD